MYCCSIYSATSITLPVSPRFAYGENLRTIGLSTGLSDRGMAELNSCKREREKLGEWVGVASVRLTSWSVVSSIHMEETLHFKDSFAFPVGTTMNPTRQLD